MPPRGQAGTSRRKRWLVAALIALVVLVPIGIAVYRHLTKPKPIQTVWSFDIHSSVTGLSTVAVSPSGFIAVQARDSILFLDAEGQLIQEIKPTAGSHFGVIFGQWRFTDECGNVYTGNDDFVQSYSPHGELRWEKELPDNSLISPKVVKRINVCFVTDEPTILTTCNSGEITEFSTTGEVINSFALPYGIYSLAAAHKLANGEYAAVVRMPDQRTRTALSVINPEGGIEFLKPYSGHSIWSLDNFGDGVLVRMHQGNVHYIDTKGNEQWSYENPDVEILSQYTPYHNSFVATSNDNTVCIVSDHNACAFNIHGEILWKLHGREGVNYIAALNVAADRQYLVVSKESAVHSFITKLYIRMRPNSQQGIKSLTKAPEPEYYLLQVDRGRVTKRWTMSQPAWKLFGPGPEGELYFVSGMDGKLNCIQPD